MKELTAQKHNRRFIDAGSIASMNRGAEPPGKGNKIIMVDYSKNSQWMLSGNDLIKDAPFFVPLGMLFGVIQLVSYRYFEQSDFGSELLQEHIPFNSLVLTVIFLLVTKAMTEWLCVKREMARTKILLTHIAERAVAFASVAASIVLGFCIITAFSGALFHTYISLIFCAYLVSLAEIAANPFLGPGQSKTYSAAIGVVSGLPLAFLFMRFL